MSGASPGSLRHHVQGTVAGAAGPYGYTLTISGSGMLASGGLGRPGLLAILLLIAGAVAAFTTLAGLAYGSFELRPATEPMPVAVWGNAHLLPAGLAVSAVAGLVRLDRGTLMWAACGFTATMIYLLVSSAQLALAHRKARAERAHGESG